MGKFIGTVKKEIKGKSYITINEYMCNCGNYYIRNKYNEIRSLKTNGVGLCNKCARIKNTRSVTKYTKHQKYINTIYRSMIARCYNSNILSYKDYGLKGIKVCNEWIGNNGFESFYRWCVDNNYSKGMSIERNDISDGYSPNNCRVIPMLEQAINKKNTIRFSFNGYLYPLRLVCKTLLLNTQSITISCKSKNITYSELIITKVGIDAFLNVLNSEKVISFRKTESFKTINF